MDKHSLANRINIVRKEKKITSRELSAKLDLNETTVRHIQSALQLPSLPAFVNLCNELDVSPSYLLSDSLRCNHQNQLDKLIKCVRDLSPKQLEVVIVTVESIAKIMKD